MKFFIFIFAVVFGKIIRFQHGGPSLFLTSKNVQILTSNLHVSAKCSPDRFNGYGLQVFDSHDGDRPQS